MASNEEKRRHGRTAHPLTASRVSEFATALWFRLLDPW
jgi:hypothetical protein